MLNPRQITDLVTHLNKRLKGEDTDCAFCMIAAELMEGYEAQCTPVTDPAYCSKCPLKRSSAIKNLSCVMVREEHLRDNENYPVLDYMLATQDSIEEHVGYMMDKANEFWNLNLCWKNTINGRRVFNKEL